jgi:multisubunit Na+/H+ antiporter MnhE subunit
VLGTTRFGAPQTSLSRERLPATTQGRRDRMAEHPGRRAATWLAWWVLLMSLWVALDDSLQSDELLVGAGAAALAALAAELAAHQAGVRFAIRPAWLVQAFRLPGQVAQDTVTVFAALARALVTRQPPTGAFRELPVRYGDDTPLGVTRRVLLTGAESLAPNTFVLGLDAERDVMVVHQLVVKE